jgi:acetyl esterase/lipase
LVSIITLLFFLHGGGYYLSDKSEEERYIEPYLKKRLNVVNMNYRLKKGVPIAIADLTNALNFLKANNDPYSLKLESIIETGFSAGGHIATNVEFSQNNPEFPNTLNQDIKITGIINLSGSVDRQDVTEGTFIDSDIEVLSTLGKALFPSDGYEVEEVYALYEPITYFDEMDPPLFLWQGGMDDQIVPKTYDAFIPLLRKNKDQHIFFQRRKQTNGRRV